MAKAAHSSGRSRSGGSGSTTRPEQTAEDDRPFSEIRKFLHDALRILSQHRWAFFVPFSILSSVVFVFSLYSPRMYTASVQFERRADPVAVDLEDPSGVAAFTYFRSTMVDDLKSEKHLAEVVENLGFTKDFGRDAEGNLTGSSIRRRDGLARALAEQLWISTNSPDDYVDQVEITYTGPDPHIGRQLVEEVKKTYIRRTKQWLYDRLASRRDYFARQLEEAEQELACARRDETRLRMENQRIDPLRPETIGLTLSQLEEERRALLMRQREYEADLTAQRQMLAMLEPEAAGSHDATDREAAVTRSTPASPEALRLTEEIRKINLEIERLQSTRGMTNLHPQIRGLMESRRAFEAELERQRASDGDQVVAGERAAATPPSGSGPSQGVPRQWQIEHAQTRVKIAALQDKLRDIDIELQFNEAAIKELRELGENALQRKEQFIEVADRVVRAKQTAGALAGTLSRINPVVEAAERDRLVHFTHGPQARGSSIPIAPRAKDILILSLLIGLVAGVGCVILAEVLDHVYRSSGHVARSLGLPILEAIDEIVTARDRRRLLVRRFVVTPLILAFGLGMTGVTGSMAYLSLSRPATYERIQRIPRTAIEFLTGSPADGDPDKTPVSVS